MMLHICSLPIFINRIPQGSGCLSILRHIETGGPVVVTDKAPDAIKGSHWPDVRTWSVLMWANGEIWTSVQKTETPEPCSILRLHKHRVEYPQMWRLVSLTENSGKN